MDILSKDILSKIKSAFPNNTISLKEKLETGVYAFVVDGTPAQWLQWAPRTTNERLRQYRHMIKINFEGEMLSCIIKEIKRVTKN
jgi:hypothetical protein